MHTIDISQFYALLHYGEFAKAHELAKNLNLDGLWQVMIEINSDQATLVSYGYIISLLIKHERADYHYLASRVLLELLHMIKGAHAASFWHAKRALALDPNNQIFKEQLLRFKNLPGHFKV